MPDNNITIAAQTIPWHSPITTVALWVYSSKPWQTASGTPINQCSPTDATITQPTRKFTCTVSLGAQTLTIAANTITSTEDAQVNPDVTLIAVFINTATGRVINGYSVFGNDGYAFRVPASPTSTTWGELGEYFAGPFTSTPRDAEVNDLHANGDITADGNITAGGHFTGSAIGLHTFPGGASLVNNAIVSTTSAGVEADSDNNGSGEAYMSVGGAVKVRAAAGGLYTESTVPFRLPSSVSGTLERLLGYNATLHRPAYRSDTEWVTLPPKTAAPTSGCVVYASAAGAALDFDPDAMTGTNDAAVIQGLLDLALVFGGVHVKVDGNCIVSGVNIHSNSWLEILPGFEMGLTSGAGRSIVRNANRTSNTAAILDKNIRVTGAFHGNYAGNGGGSGTFSDRQEADGSFKVALQFFGVENLHVEARIRQARTFGVHLTNVRDVEIPYLYVSHTDQTAAQNINGLQMEGNCYNVHIGTLVGVDISDDTLACNANDDPVLGPFVIGGPIIGVRVDELVLEDCWFGVRFLSNTARIDQVSIGVIRGSVSEYVARFDNRNYPLGDSIGANPGNIGYVAIEDIRVTGFVSAVPQAYDAMVRVESYCEHLKINMSMGNSYTVSPTYKPLLIVHGGGLSNGLPTGLGDVKVLELGLTIVEGTGSSVPGSPAGIDNRVVIQGKVDLMRLDANVQRTSAVAKVSGLLRVETGSNAQGIRELHVTGFVERMLNTFTISSGKITVLKLDHFTDLAQPTAVELPPSGGMTLYMNNIAATGNMRLYRSNLWLGGDTFASRLHDPGSKVTQATGD